MRSDTFLQNFLTEDELMRRVPTAFLQSPTMPLSDKYTHIPTSRVIEDLDKLG